MNCGRALLVSVLVSLSCLAGAAVFAEDKPLTESLIDLVRNKHDFKAAWGTMFKGEYSPPAWVSSLEGNSDPARQITVDGKEYVFGSMCNANDCAGDRIVVLFSGDHKKSWALEVIVPPGLGQDSTDHPLKYGTLRYFGEPDPPMKKLLLAQFERDLSRSAAPASTAPASTAPAATTPAPTTPAPTTPAPTTPTNTTPTNTTPTATTPAAPADFSPQNDEAARKFRAELHVKKGVEMMKANNFRQAESEFKEACKQDPDNVLYLESYANATHKANDARESIEAYSRLLKADAAHHPEAHFILADSLSKLMRFDEAIEEYKKAAPIEKDKAAIWHKVAEIRIRQAKSAEAMEAYKNAIKAQPNEGKAYRLLASMQWNAGAKADALKTYRDGAKNASSDGDLQAAFAYALMSEQQWQEAAKAYKAAALVKGSSAELEAGYRSAMEHIAYDEQQAARKAAQDAEKAEKAKKKHRN
jgi:tetratricopeptide (TPR) repeat protein